MAEVRKPHRKSRWAPIVATGFGLGYLPKAPGTFGSLLGIPAGIAIHIFGHWVASQYTYGYGELIALALIVLCLIALAIFALNAIKHTEAQWGSHDDQRIVIDEVAGQAIALAFFSPSFTIAIAGFLLFRAFDIAKPGPIRWADQQLPAPWGTLVDDLLAGIAAAVVIFFLVKIGVVAG